MKNLFAGILVFGLALVADAQTWLAPNFYTNITGPSQMLLGTVTNLAVLTPVIVNPGYGFTLYSTIGTTNNQSMLQALSLYICGSVDGVTFEPTNNNSKLVQFVVGPGNVSTSAGTNVYTTNLPSWMFDGYRSVQITTLVAGTNAVTYLGPTGLSRRRLDY